VALTVKLAATNLASDEARSTALAMRPTKASPDDAGIKHQQGSRKRSTEKLGGLKRRPSMNVLRRCEEGGEGG
jgi:hypothetical protein